jgi:hypothetical protein
MENEDVTFGGACQVKFVDQPVISEDGIVLDPETLKKFELQHYDNRAFTYGDEFFPPNVFKNTPLDPTGG